MNHLPLSDVCNLTSRTEEELLLDHLFPEPLSNGLYTEQSINRYLKIRNSPVLTVDEVATRLHFKQNKIYQLIREGTLASVVKGKPKTGIYWYSVDEYLRKKERQEYFSYPSRFELKQSYNDFYQEVLRRHPDKKFCFITLTLKKVFETEGGLKVYINREEVEKYLRLFLNKMDRFVYKNSFKRYGKRLVSLTSIETDFTSQVCENIRDRFHCHILLEIPERYQGEKFWMFKLRILQTFWELDWSYNEYDIQRVEESPERVVGYITKGGEETVLLSTSYF